MAKARKCDRCGKLYEPKSVTIKGISGKVNSIGLTDKDFNEAYWTRDCLDLCPKCLEELSKWLTMKQDKEA